DREAALRPGGRRLPHVAARGVLRVPVRRRPVRAAPRAHDHAVAARAGPVRGPARGPPAGRLARPAGRVAVPPGVRLPGPLLLRPPLHPGAGAGTYLGLTPPRRSAAGFLDSAASPC